MKTTNDNATLAAMGLAAMIPGVKHAQQAINQLLDSMLAQLEAMQNGSLPKRGRPPGLKSKTAGPWAGMTPEQRSAEMKRRISLRKVNGHPRDADHPGHAAWAENLRKATKARWAKMSPKEKTARQAAMQAGKKAAA